MDLVESLHLRNSMVDDVVAKVLEDETLNSENGDYIKPQ